jgi:triacylglycerol lipase
MRLAAAFVVSALGCGDTSPAAGGDDGETEVAASETTTTLVPTASADGTAGSPSDETTTAATTSSSGDVDSTGPAVAPGPYPIVLAHGFFGFDAFAGVEFIDYFWHVRARLADAGETQVFTPAVDPFNDSTVRGEQLLAHVEGIIAETGAAKVNLIGHSQGGLDARVVAHLRPDLVASVTTFATPHQGTPVADVALGLAGDPNAQAIIDALVALAGAPLWPEVDGDTSLSASMQQLSTPGIARFNAAYPDAPGVEYYSLAGRSGLALGGAACASAAAPDFVAAMDPQRDPIEALLVASHTLLLGDLLDPVVSDGLVRAQDSHWGVFLGCVPADHFDEIGHLFGDVPGLTNPWRHDEFYVQLVAWLRTRDL